jgi:hypothetical protein
MKRTKQTSRGSGWQKNLALIPVTAADTPSAPRRSEAFLRVDAITRAAEQSGWPTPEAFACGMLMHIHGVTVAEAQAAFADCQRRVQ